jgi:type II secretory pathway component GspD/PulD (secretin)
VQGDRRSNVMAAPKVTTFNGLPASISNQTLRPFVISVVPVVSAFAVGFQPIITVIPEGISLSVAAVVSADRRYVRLSVFPLFTTITDVFTFSFITGGGVGGAAQQGAAQQGAAQAQGQAQAQQQTGQQGAGAAITVQQPVVDQVTVTTVVSVPDGGTVLLGGVKQLSEQRNMAGVPILNKIPYISRLFKNTGVGRDTSSLMLMVTPRIIIQEEEEELLGIPPQ